MEKVKILQVGCGAMGTALRQGLMHQKSNHIVVVDPHVTPSKTAVTSFNQLPADYQPDIILFAIKPQLAAEVLPQYSLFNRPGVTFISIMTGISTASMKQYLKLENDAFVVRAMPNLALVIEQGMTGIYASPSLPQDIQGKIEQLFCAVGQVVWVADEDQLNIVTAISGSGPAYFFYLAEMLAKSAQTLGLPENVAVQLARQTLVGAGTMLNAMPESAAQLRANVTSPGGTTAAATSVFDQENALENLLLKAVMAAYNRAKELSA